MPSRKNVYKLNVFIASLMAGGLRMRAAGFVERFFVDLVNAFNLEFLRVN